MIGAAQSVPGSHFWTAGPPMVSVLVFYTGVFLFAVFPLTRLPGRWIATLILSWLLCGWIIPQQTAPFLGRNSGSELTCTIVDVGHGSGVLIQLPDGKNVLYDCGSFGAADYGARNIAGVLWSERIEHLDAVILSHADVDHFNALPDLAEKFSIDVVFVSPQMLESSSPAVDRLFHVLHQQGISIRAVALGDRLFENPTVNITMLWPPRTGTGGNDNSDSIVLLLEHAGSRILLPGDLEQDGLSTLISTNPVNCDIVMAPHHGSTNSQPELFMNWCTPEFVVISGGSQRVSDATVSLFNAPGRKVARTDRDGAIRLKVDERGIQMQCWNHQPW
jgi:competence protein ComEC